MAETQTEKRQHQREKSETLVRFEGDHFSIYSRATDISHGGAFLVTHYLLDPGTPIELNIIDTAGEETKRQGKVIRTVSQATERGEVHVGLGVEFVENDPTIVP